MEAILWVLLFIFLTAASGVYFTGIGCRRALARHRHPGWHLILLGISITTILTALFVGQGVWFHPNQWNRRAVGILPEIIVTMLGAAISLVSSLIMVSTYRSKARKNSLT
jgi:hypothetical protein